MKFWGFLYKDEKKTCGFLKNLVNMIELRKKILWLFLLISKNILLLEFDFLTAKMA